MFRRIFQLSALVVFCLSLKTVAASHVTGNYVYSNVGWRSIATGDRHTFHIADSLPIYNGNGVTIRPAIREAVDAWNITRPRYYSYLYEDVFDVLIIILHLQVLVLLGQVSDGLHIAMIALEIVPMSTFYKSASSIREI